MKKIVLISCVKSKRQVKSKAKDLYISPFFRKSLNYAISLQPDKIFILSAKYGLVGLNEEIEPYEKTLSKGMDPAEKKDWAITVLNKLKEISNLEKDEFIFLAGNNYRENLIPHLKNYQIPMKGLNSWKQLQWLTSKTKK